LLRHHAEGVAAVNRAEPRAALGAGAGRPAVEDATLGVDGDVGLAVGMDRVHDRRCFERDRRGVGVGYSPRERHQGQGTYYEGDHRVDRNARTNHLHTPTMAAGASRSAPTYFVPYR